MKEFDKTHALGDDALEKVSGGTGYYILTTDDFENTTCCLTSETETQWGGGEKTDENLSTLCGLVDGQSGFISPPTTLTYKP